MGSRSLTPGTSDSVMSELFRTSVYYSHFVSSSRDARFASGGTFVKRGDRVIPPLIPK